jgi:hypothetical protein
MGKTREWICNSVVSMDKGKEQQMPRLFQFLARLFVLCMYGLSSTFALLLGMGVRTFASCVPSMPRAQGRIGSCPVMSSGVLRMTVCTWMFEKPIAARWPGEHM